MYCTCRYEGVVWFLNAHWGKYSLSVLCAWAILKKLYENKRPNFFLGGGGGVRHLLTNGKCSLLMTNVVCHCLHNQLPHSSTTIATIESLLIHVEFKFVHILTELYTTKCMAITFSRNQPSLYRLAFLQWR